MTQSRSQRPIKKSLRLIFQYEGETIQLSSIKRVNTIAPPSDALTPGERASGFWYEVRDRSNQPLYRRVADMPNRYDVEVRSDDPASPPTWQTIDKPQGVFVALVPDLGTAQDLVLFSSPIRPLDITPGVETMQARQELEPAQEVARFSLSGMEPERR